MHKGLNKMPDSYIRKSDYVNEKLKYYFRFDCQCVLSTENQF
ncbi:hypothetical protein ABID99_001961 [Mucilaginibacter sp. OAE612]